MLNASSARRQDRSACGLSFSSALSSAWRAATHAVVAGDARSEMFSRAWVQQDPRAAVGASGAGDVAPVRQGTRGDGRVAGLARRRDGDVIEIPGCGRITQGARGPPRQQAPLPRRHDQAPTQLVVRVTGPSAEQRADLSYVRGQHLEHVLRRDNLLHQVQPGRPCFQLPDHGLVQGTRPGQGICQPFPYLAVPDCCAGAGLRRQREQIAASHGRPVPSDGLGEQLQVERVGRDSRHRARGRARACRGVPGQAQRLAQPRRHVGAVGQFLKGRRELGGVHAPLVVAQGALGDSGQGGELALGDLASFEDGDHRARVLPQARLVEVLTCENGG